MPPDGERVDVAIVGGGLAGLCVAYEVSRQAPHLRWQLFEAAGHLGGKILTERIEFDGGRFIVEAGPDAFLTQKPWARDLAEDLGLGDRLIPINRVARPVAILKRGRLVDLPDGVTLIAPANLWSFFRSPLLSPLGRARVALEVTLRPREGDADESLGAFVRRRLGREALEWIAEPLVAGIYNADPDDLSLAATFPAFRALERTHGSVIAGLRASRTAAPASAPPVFLSFKDGVQELTDALIARVAGNAQLSTPIDSVRRTDGGMWELSAPPGKVSASCVVLATPASVAAALIDGSAQEAAGELRKLRTASAGSVSLAFPAMAVRRPPHGFGVVIPRCEQAPINAITIASRKFAERAPEGWELIRVFFGGARSPASMMLDDDELIRMIRAQLNGLFGIESEPAVQRIHRWPSGSPQYDTGHLDRVAAIERALPPGLYLTGSPYKGVGIPDIARAARETGGAVARSVAISREPALT